MRDAGRAVPSPVKNAEKRVGGLRYNSSGVPNASTLPSFMIRILSEMAKASSLSWVTYSIVVEKASCMALILPLNFFLNGASNAYNGSSKRRISGSEAMALARATRCASPPLSVVTFLFP